MPPKSTVNPINAPAAGVSLTSDQVDVSWRVLSGLLQDKETDEVKHAQVQQLAERLFSSSVLAGSPDVNALEVLSVSLIQQSRWSAVVTLLAPHSALVAKRSTLSFHLAYALYRDKHHAKCLDELKKRAGASAASAAASSAGLSEGELHLQAQALYRAGQYGAAARVYRDTQLAEDDDVEMQANMLAALVSAGQLDDAKAYMKKLLVLSDPASFELAYNASCALIESGDYSGALATVRKAESMCNEILSADGASEGEIEHELAGLRVQEAFILQQLSELPGAKGTENEQALALYTKVLGDKHADPNVASIASNNIITLRTGSSKIWDSLKKSNKAMDIDLKDMTLSVRQRSTIQLNRALVLLHGRQNDKCRELLAGLTKEFHNNAQIALAQAAVLAKDKTRVREAEEGLREWLKSNEATASAESVQSMFLGLAHLALLRSDIPAAINCITALLAKKGGGLQHKPATVATLVALHERNGDVDAAHGVIQSAIQHWSASSKKDPNAARLLQRVLSSAGAFYSRHGREQDAAALLEALAAETQSGSSAASRSESVARLVLAYAHAGNAAKEAQYVAQLPALSIPAALDVNQLESVPAPEQAKRKPKKKGAAASASSASASAAKPADGGETDTDGEFDEEEEGKGEEEDGAAAPSASLAKAAARAKAKDKSKASQLAKKKRLIPKRYPKGFDPANPGPPPDPERWLPRWERSNQKKFNKRRTGNAIRGAQGSTNMANMPTKEVESMSVESKGQVSGAAAAAARKRAGKKAKPTDK